MRWSFPVGRLFGVQVLVHATFPLLLIYVALESLAASHDIHRATQMVVLTLLMFGCVLAHEFGHVLTARRFGCQTRNVTILPIGGVANLESLPEKPWQELLMAAAGPLVNAAIVLALLPIVGLKVLLSSTANDPDALLDNLPLMLMAANVFMAVFNLLPAFPMDGGRMLRALLAMRISYVRATQIAARVGRILAVVFCAASFWTSPTLAIIGVVVWIGAGREASVVTSRALLDGVRVRSAMLTDFGSLSPFDTLGETVSRVIAGVQKSFPVVNQGHLMGLLTHRNLVRSLSLRGGDVLVSDVMNQDYATASPEEQLQQVLARVSVQGQEATLIPVLDGDQLVGLLSLENIGEYLALRDAISRHAPPVMISSARPLPEA